MLSNKIGLNTRAFSSAGRASALQAEGHRFEPYNAHHFHCGLVVQLVRMPACHAGGRRFEPVPGRQLSNLSGEACWRGSMAEQLICNQQVVGSTPTVGFFGPLAQLVRATGS